MTGNKQYFVHKLVDVKHIDPQSDVIEYICTCGESFEYMDYDRDAKKGAKEKFQAHLEASNK